LAGEDSFFRCGFVPKTVRNVDVRCSNTHSRTMFSLWHTLVLISAQLVVVKTEQTLRGGLIQMTCLHTRRTSDECSPMATSFALLATVFYEISLYVCATCFISGNTKYILFISLLYDLQLNEHFSGFIF
jgi:hypothetical protein